MAFNYSGIILVGTMISLAIFFTILTIPLIIFSDLNALDAIKYSFQLLKTTSNLPCPYIVSILLSAMVGFIGCCIECFSLFHSCIPCTMPCTTKLSDHNEEEIETSNLL
jgi:hypothetical protein